MNNKLLFYCVLLMLIVFSCQRRMNKEATMIVNKLSLDQKIGQMIMVGVPGQKMSKASKRIIERYLPGGIILFGYNLKQREEIGEFIDNLQQISISKSAIPLFISVDEEGGRVKRIRDGVTQFPGNMAFGVVGNEDHVFDSAKILGIQLRLLGVNMNLAPVLDVNNNPNNPVINTRSFGSDPSLVSRMGKSYIEGLQKSGCIAVGKHFPGHGDTDKDSHITLPVIPYGIDRLEGVEFPPFVEAVKAGVECIMTAHISYPNIVQNNLPATVSERFLKDILRGRMKFEGLIISDDMEMKAISKMMDIGHVAVQAIQAGVDIVLISTYGKNIEKVVKAIKAEVDNGGLSVKRIDQSVKRIIELKLRYGIMGYEDGKIRYCRIRYDDEEMELVKKAEELNRIISREAIYLYEREGGESILKDFRNYQRVFMTSNEILQRELQKGMIEGQMFTNDRDLIKYLKDFNSGFKKGIIDSMRAVVYYNFNKVELVNIKRIKKLSEERGVKLVLLSTGNPFPLSDIEGLPPTLFTFSNTEESLKQLVAVLKGEFEPRRSINVYLGLDNLKE